MLLLYSQMLDLMSESIFSAVSKAQSWLLYSLVAKWYKESQSYLSPLSTESCFSPIVFLDPKYTIFIAIPFIFSNAHE